MSVRTEVFALILALISAVEVSSSRVGSVISSLPVVNAEAVLLALPPPNTGTARPIMDVFAAREGEG